MQACNLRCLAGKVAARRACTPYSVSSRRPAAAPQRQLASSTARPAGTEALWSPLGNGHATPINDSLDAIIMLAGGQTEGGGNPPWVIRRLDAVHDLHKMQRVPDRSSVLLLGGGTPHKPPCLDERGYVIHEATGCSRYLLDRGMAARHMLKEVSSYDTVGNAYFSLAIHALPAGWRRIAVVTSDFHMPRTAALFRDMYALAGQQLFNDRNRFELSFVAASDEGIFEPDVLAARKEKEAQALASWQATSAKLQTLPQLHAWLHQTHLCYAVARQGEFGVPTIQDAKVLASY